MRKLLNPYSDYVKLNPLIDEEDSESNYIGKVLKSEKSPLFESIHNMQPEILNNIAEDILFSSNELDTLDHVIF